MKPSKNFYQWDINQKFTECDGRFVDFIINEKVVYRVDIVNGECIIPDEFLQTSGYHTIYECMSDYTIQNHMFPVHPREKPPGYVYTPTEKLTFEGLVQKVNDTVADIIHRADTGEFDGYTPVKGKDYFTEDEKNEMVQSVSSGAVGEFREVVDSATADFNKNSSVKTNDYNTNAETKTAEFDSNAAEKLKAYNDNHTEKMTAYDTNATDKLSTYNSNAEQKLESYNSNHTEKLTEYNTNAETKTAEFDSNAAALQTEVDRLRGECDTLQAENRKQENRISALMKLNKGQTYDIVPEEGEVASRTAPSGAKYVSVDKVGGKSIVWNQLCNPDEFAPMGCTPTESGGVVTISDCVEVNRYKAGFIPVTKGHKYYQTVKIKSDGANPVGFQNYLFLNAIKKTTSAEFSRLSEVATCNESGNALVQLYSTAATDYQIIKNSFMLFDLTLLFGAGNEPTAEQFERMFPAESYPYNPGEIVSSTTKTVDFTPGNIYPGTKATTYFPCKISKGETFTVSAMCRINTVKARYTTEDGNQKDYYTLSDLVGTYEEGKSRYKRRIKAPFDISRLMFDVSEGESASDFVVEIGEGDGTYKRYFEPAQITTGFPELRSALVAHDYIDMDGGTIQRNVGAVDLGTLTWDNNGTFEDGNVRFIARVPGRAYTTNGLCDKFEKSEDNALGTYTLRTTGDQIVFTAPKGTEIHAFIESMSGATLYYELATPTTEPVTIPEPLQEWLPVEPGGTVTFKNADESKQLAVPNAVSWVRKLDEV